MKKSVNGFLDMLSYYFYESVAAPLNIAIIIVFCLVLIATGNGHKVILFLLSNLLVWAIYYLINWNGVE